MKTDESIHNICIASIKRKIMKPYDFKFTNFYNFNTDLECTGIQIDLEHNELIICSTIIDINNFSILTTRRLFTSIDCKLSIENIQGATDKYYGDFKGYKDENFTFGQVQLQNGNDMKYFIETGKASMIMIYGLRTLVGATQIKKTNS